MSVSPSHRPGLFGIVLTDLVYLPVLPFLALYVLWNMLKSGKYRRSWWRRWGWGLTEGVGRFKGPVIWIHAVSVGEVRAAVPLVKALRERLPDHEILVTTTTETGNDTARSVLKDCRVWWTPWDMAWNVARWVRRIRPALFIVLENDVWPNLVRVTKRSGAKVGMVNGKISDRSFKKYQSALNSPLRGLVKGLWAPFDMVCVQTALDAERIERLVRDPDCVYHTGNLKFDFPPEKITEDQKVEWRQRLGIREDQMVFVAGSTHDGEEALMMRFVDWVVANRDGHLILVPRHPERFDAVWELINNTAFSCQRWSDPQPGAMITMVDEMGLLTKLYSLATVAIVCGSWRSDIGGHNVMEPAQFGVPVVFGPHMHAQRGMRNVLMSAGGGVQVASDDQHDLIKAVDDLLDTEGKLATMGRGAREAVESNLGSAEVSVERLLEILR